MIAVIAVLIAILMPTIAAARFEARSVVCRSNVRQLTVALMDYAVEAKGKFPPNLSLPSPGQFWYDDARVGSRISRPASGAVHRQQCVCLSRR